MASSLVKAVSLGCSVSPPPPATLLPPHPTASRALTPAGVQPQAPEGQKLSSQGSSKEAQRPQSLSILHPKLALLQ